MTIICSKLIALLRDLSEGGRETDADPGMILRESLARAQIALAAVPVISRCSPLASAD